MTDALPSIEDRVSKGIAWLEEQGAYDWAEKIVAAVDASTFDMASACRCAVGSTLRNWDEVFNGIGEEDDSRLSHDTAVLYGTVPPSYHTTRAATWDALEAEWERRAREHASYRAEVLEDA